MTILYISGRLLSGLWGSTHPPERAHLPSAHSGLLSPISWMNWQKGDTLTVLALENKRTAAMICPVNRGYRRRVKTRYSTRLLHQTARQASCISSKETLRRPEEEKKKKKKRKHTHTLWTHMKLFHVVDLSIKYLSRLYCYWWGVLVMLCASRSRTVASYSPWWQLLFCQAATTLTDSIFYIIFWATCKES